MTDRWKEVEKICQSALELDESCPNPPWGHAEQVRDTSAQKIDHALKGPSGPCSRVTGGLKAPQDG
jgi:hypothetical protein